MGRCLLNTHMDHDYEQRKATWEAAQARMAGGYNRQMAHGLNRAERRKQRYGTRKERRWIREHTYTKVLWAS